MAAQPTTAPKPQVPDEVADRRDQLLDAALRVISAQGLRGLTHRAVEAEAGVPHGSTTYYFGTRQDLLIALIRHMADRGRRNVQPIAHGLAIMLADRSKPVDIESIALALLAWIDSESEMELARYELQIAGARDPEMKELMTENCDIFRQMCEPIVIACGSTDPLRDSHIVQAAIDGWMFDRLTHTNPDDQTMVKGLTDLLGAIGKG
jgi:DNA-binding transcriptional regulator YbjK